MDENKIIRFREKLRSFSEEEINKINFKIRL